MNREKKFRELYSENSWFQDQYKKHRGGFYKKTVQIVEDSNVTDCLDIGCSYGLMVELMNRNNIDAFGVDLRIEELIEFHKRLPYSKGKFLYGSVNDEAFVNSIAEKCPRAITLVETLRFLENPGFLGRLNAELIIIREVSNNGRNRRSRAGEFDVRLYSPLDLLQILPEYECRAVYFLKSLVRINKPLRFVLRIINAVLPSYTLILKRKSPFLAWGRTDERKMTIRVPGK